MMARARARARALAVAIALFAACGTNEPSKRSLPPAPSPAGESFDVLTSRLHDAHLGGTSPLECVACHDLGAVEFVAPDRAKCLGCHPDRATAIHGETLLCARCHQFDAAPVAAAENGRPAIDCLSCHAEPQGEERAIRAHAKIDCQSCHRPHDDPALSIADCLTCHEDHERGHGKPGQSTIERCSDCHPPHTKSIEAVALCGNCHKDRFRNLRGHNRCEVCHEGDRSSRPKQVRACTDCHKANAALAAAKVADHGRCESCHAPHDPLGTARQSCRRCHGEVKPAHPGAGQLGSCLGCHPAHPKSADITVASCTSCHRAAGNERGFHAAGKTSCRDCHDAHDFSPPACASCHEPEKAQVAAGHARCEGCHVDKHRAAATPTACASCHRAEQASAPSGHRECVNCHQPHGGSLVRAAECTTCHAPIAKAQHGQIAGGCANCHRPHGPGGKAEPPACASCHQPSRLPGLHAVDDHRRCATCHGGHALKALNRQTCLENCHQAQIDHEPVAKTCVGCHPFGGTRR